jgi:ectoine hydroxylase
MGPLRRTTFSLSAEERRAYDEDGFFVRARVFDATEVAELRDAAERAVAEAAAGAPTSDDYVIDGNRYREAAGSTIQFEHQPGSETIRVIEPFHHLDPRLDRLIDDARLVEPARELVGDERIALFTDKLNLKRPGEGSRFRWHQDSPYWAHFFHELHRLPNAMINLDGAHEGNGCFRVIRGSHHRGLLPGLEGEGELGPLFTDPAHFDESAQVPLVVPAGSVIFFSPHTVHGSQPNESDEFRRAFVITYQPGGHRMFKVDAKREAGVATE